LDIYKFSFDNDNHSHLVELCSIIEEIELIYENTIHAAKYVGVAIAASFATVAGIQDSAYIDKNIHGKAQSTVCDAIEADRLPSGPRLMLNWWFDQE
jgi:hypothetical protein